MPLLPFTPTFIEIPVSDRVFNDTTIKQKAKFISLNHSQSETESRVYVTVLVSLYADDNGDYGAKLTGSGFHPYQVQLVADNNCIVDVENGEILAIRTTEDDVMWGAIADLNPKNVMFQGDFFQMLRENQSLNIGELIRKHILDANSFGKFNA